MLTGEGAHIVSPFFFIDEIDPFQP